ncbi:MULTISPECIES: type II toxin-antitoxin system RelE/ParE family toxin [Marisediminitalea]|jgi:toxin ParE1/3/4|uniref:type II toxin-antitoxin system RelE/ParE family toxin n=1 Tax=Marisediminitalea TaxID=2662254 RepID=UPI000C3CE575|nr:type II toxin-antitoxin system RelE/ParE family toxin [Marisediminitalea aggregata]MBL52980.1 plasmid stabilization protein [Alteromonadaceae bacterium]MCP3863099.1 type II toxin-antitoxin system RelE/ParE family toxin [Aestuariibacter sp.]MCP4237914.1 type II toxin-antitoxin system RelE/ParE family toxin [Aestuariibacter sp.]MCP4526430.1 type II toxin-antitoxin system RelE/ParE family toxin [Aestuariibacter sp.]MCP4946097.1 type II toxin-antitoxin system RelE/ParE family toxin [Aestuariiba|tara:strand:- start:1366 stop:1653 length:288 start_codon:yes stop_codon:yes gene_type:complete
MPRYQLTPDAAEDIERLFLFGIERFGVQQATKYLDGLQLRLLQIAESPQTYPMVEHIRTGYRRSVYGVHAIYFRTIDEEAVEISRVIGRELLDAL